MNARMWPIVAACMLVLASLATAQTTSAVWPISEVLFSVNPPNFATTWPTTTFTDGDLLSERGTVVASNAYLLRNFHPAPSFAPIPFGLDAISVTSMYDPRRMPSTRYLFSINTSFPDTVLGREISDGDLLSDAGQIVATNAQLLQYFHPMPPVADMGLDAVCMPNFRLILPAEFLRYPPEWWFSTNRGWFDEGLGQYISDGDLLSNRGRVVATNEQLMRNFHPAPTMGPVAGYGLDAAFVPQFNVRLATTSISYLPPEIWFSTTRGWYDTVLQRYISPGDLLSTTGRVVRTNKQLLYRFNVSADLGLDAVFVRVLRTDFNLDGSVDLGDFSLFQSCFNGPNRLIADECATLDVDDDSDVDLADFGQFQATFTGPNHPTSAAP